MTTVCKNWKLLKRVKKRFMRILVSVNRDVARSKKRELDNRPILRSYKWVWRRIPQWGPRGGPWSGGRLKADHSAGSTGRPLVRGSSSLKQTAFLVLVHPIKVGRLAPFLTDPYPSLKNSPDMHQSQQRPLVKVVWTWQSTPSPHGDATVGDIGTVVILWG